MKDDTVVALRQPGSFSDDPLTGILRVGGGLPDLHKVSPRRDRHGRGWIGITANQGYVVTGVEQTPLLPALAFLLLILGAALIAWYREGH